MSMNEMAKEDEIELEKKKKRKRKYKEMNMNQDDACGMKKKKKCKIGVDEKDEGSCSIEIVSAQREFYEMIAENAEFVLEKGVFMRIGDFYKRMETALFTEDDMVNMVNI